MSFQQSAGRFFAALKQAGLPKGWTLSKNREVVLGPITDAGRRSIWLGNSSVGLVQSDPSDLVGWALAVS